MWVAFTSVAVVLAVACVVLMVLGSLRPRRFAFAARPGVRWGLGAAAIVLVVAVSVVELRPAYEVAVSVPQDPVAGEESAVTVTAENLGLWNGTFEAECLVDGRSVGTVTIEVESGRKASSEVPLPKDLLAGDHVVEVAGAASRMRVLRPAAFEVAAVERAGSPVKSGGRAEVTVTVANTGEVDGTYKVKLRVDDEVVARKEVPVPAGSTAEVTFKPKLRGEREHTIAAGEKSVTVRSVQTTRYASGHELRWKVVLGVGAPTTENPGGADGLVILASSKSAPTTRIAVYVRARSTAVVDGIPDGTYWVYYTLGRDWAPSRKGFLTVTERGSFTEPLDYTTTYEADGSYYYDRWTIGLKPTDVDESEAVPVDPVDEGDFPTLDGGAPSQTV